VGALIGAMQPTPGHAADRVSIGSAVSGVVGGVVSWVASRREDA